MKKNNFNNHIGKIADNFDENSNTSYKTESTEPEYLYYSRVLKEPFTSLADLKEAEEAYYAKLRAKEDKVAQKKADAKKVEDAFVALNAARKAYKDDLITLTTEYSNALKDLKETFDFGKKDIAAKLAEAEETYKAALKAFTEKYPEGYHLTLKDGDFETTISSNIISSNGAKTKEHSKAFDIIDMLFNSL